MLNIKKLINSVLIDHLVFLSAETGCDGFREMYLAYLENLLGMDVQPDDTTPRAAA